MRHEHVKIAILKAIMNRGEYETQCAVEMQKKRYESRIAIWTVSFDARSSLARRDSVRA